MQAFALFLKMLGELDDQDRVFRRQAHRGQQAHLEVHVIAQATDPRRQYRADHTQRHHKHDRERHRPALVQGGQTEKHEQHGNGVEHRRLGAGQAQLIGLPGPLVTDAFGKLLDDGFNGIHRGTRADTWRRIAHHLK